MQDASRRFQLPSDAQIRLMFATLIGFGIAIYLGMKVGEGNARQVAGLGVIVLSVTVLLAFGSRAWVFLPLGMSLDVPVPVTFGRDFSARELTAMLMIGYTLFLVATRRQKVVIFRREHLWPICYVGWAVVVFARNPSGLLSFGSETVGARHYFALALALGLFIVSANARIEEKDVKWMFGGMFAASMTNTVYAWWGARMSFAPEIVRGIQDVDYYTWQQAIAGPSSLFFTVLLAFYPMKDLIALKSMKWWPLMGLAVGMSLISGKRMGVLMVALLPLFAALVRREVGRGLVIALFLVGVGLALALGQGRLFDLPLNTQRALSTLPGNWHPSANLGATDEYRRQLREDAIERIKDHPWIGRGFAINTTEAWVEAMETRGSKIITGLRAGGSWHTTWLGICADFGIPAALIWGLLLWQFTRLSYQTSHAWPEGTWRKALAIYIFFSMCLEWTNSWTSGHSALQPFSRWWLWGMILPLVRQAEAERVAATLTSGISPGAVQPQQETHAFTR